MKIAFLASRKGYLKVMGSLIQAALDHGHEALLLTDPGERKPGEATTAEDLAHWPRARVLPIQRGASLAPLLARERAEALVGPSLHFVLASMGPEGDTRAVRAAGVRLYSVDYIVEALNSRPEAYRLLDRTFYTSEYERSWHWHGSPFKDDFESLRQSLDLSARSAVGGSTMLDQLGLVDRVGGQTSSGARAGQAGGAVHVAQDGGPRAPAAIRLGRRIGAHPDGQGRRPRARGSRPRDLEGERVPGAGPGHPPIL